MPPISVFRCYLKDFGKMVIKIIILYHKVLQRGLLATFCFIKIDFIMKQCGKKQLHCISQKILLTSGDSDIMGLVDYVIHYILASFRFEDEDEDKDENEDQGQLLLILRMLKSVTVMT